MQRFHPNQFKENIEVPRFTIHETYKLTETNFVLIGEPKEPEGYNIGLRIMLLTREADRFKVRYLSYGTGESRVYRPAFYRGNNKVVVVCEMAAEYSWGLDAYLLENNQMKKLGNLNIAAQYDTEDHPESAIPFLHIAESEEALHFRFKKRLNVNGKRLQDMRLYYRPGQEEQTVIPPSAIQYSYHKEAGWQEEKRP